MARYSFQLNETPNHALQRTAPCVTAPASTAAFPPSAQVPRRTPLSLSLGSLGVATRSSMKKSLIALFFALSQFVEGQTISAEPKRFSPDHLLPAQSAACKAFREMARPRDPDELKKLFSLGVLPVAKANPVIGHPGEVTYETPFILMTRDDVILLFGKPDSEDPTQISYTGSKGQRSGSFIIRFNKGYVVALSYLETVS